MENKDIIHIKSIKNIKVCENISLKNYTSFKLNEVASMIVYPSDVSALQELLTYLNKEKIKYVIVIGTNEISSGQLKIKNMNEGTDISVNIDEVETIKL